MANSQQTTSSGKEYKDRVKEVNLQAFNELTTASSNPLSRENTRPSERNIHPVEDIPCQELVKHLTHDQYAWLFFETEKTGPVRRRSPRASRFSGLDVYTDSRLEDPIEVLKQTSYIDLPKYLSDEQYAWMYFVTKSTGFKKPENPTFGKGLPVVDNEEGYEAESESGSNLEAGMRDVGAIQNLELADYAISSLLAKHDQLRDTTVAQPSASQTPSQDADADAPLPQTKRIRQSWSRSRAKRKDKAAKRLISPVRPPPSVKGFDLLFGIKDTLALRPTNAHDPNFTTNVLNWLGRLLFARGVGEDDTSKHLLSLHEDLASALDISDLWTVRDKSDTSVRERMEKDITYTRRMHAWLSMPLVVAPGMTALRKRLRSFTWDKIRNYHTALRAECGYMRDLDEPGSEKRDGDGTAWARFWGFADLWRLQPVQIQGLNEYDFYRVCDWLSRQLALPPFEFYRREGLRAAANRRLETITARVEEGLLEQRDYLSDEAREINLEMLCNDEELKLGLAAKEDEEDLIIFESD